MTQLKMLSTDDTIAEIRRLYFKTTRQTIQQDLAKALDLLKALPGEDERERATVYMEGLAEMQKDWLKAARPKGGGASKKAQSARPAGGRPRGGAKKA